jgi:hypothetical protein
VVDKVRGKFSIRAHHQDVKNSKWVDCLYQCHAFQFVPLGDLETQAVLVLPVPTR